MKIAHLAGLTAVGIMVVGMPSVFAAPSESVESAGASSAYQKVNAVLSEQIVAGQLQAIGLTSQQAHARLSQLNAEQLSQLAAQADLIQVGGTIESDASDKWGPLHCMWHQLTTFATNVYRLVFCWADLK
ncbi:MAG TPA: PA2779 family protein [Verrucomicrobiae bacterium]|nr:PA2779 family protein [Verrucomicrobiae bacterium]